MIPKIIHYVWVGPNALPEADRRRIETWRRMLPGWEIRAWGNQDVDYSSPYLRMAYAVRAWNRVSDYTRMDALARYGGVYLDTDVDLIRPLEPFLDRQAFLGFQIGDEMPGEMVNGAVFGARPGHWLPIAIRRYFNERLDGRTDVGSFAGPGLLTQTLREKGLERYSDEPVEIEQVSLYPKRYFYPYSWTETYSDSVITPDTYAVHRWAETWVNKGGASLPTRLRKKVINRLGRHVPAVALELSRMAAVRGQRRAEKGA